MLMRKAFPCLFMPLSGCLLLVALPSGCTTRSGANAQAQAAFAAGERQATARQAMGPSVSFRGDVKKPSVAWTEGLTLAPALLAAEYSGLWDPHTILIIRNGERFQIDPKRFLRGLEDPPLAPGDTVEIHR